jgi:hypothetical protein
MHTVLSRVARSYLCRKGPEGRAMKKLIGAVIAAGAAALTPAPAAYAYTDGEVNYINDMTSVGMGPPSRFRCSWVRLTRSVPMCAAAMRLVMRRH